MGIKSYSESIRDAMAEEMRRDEKVVLWGLDVGAYGGAFGASKNSGKNVSLICQFPRRAM